MSKVTTRPAEARDLEAVAALFDSYRQFYEMPADLALARRYLTERFQNKESVIIVAENEAGELVGFTQLYPAFCSVLAAKTFVLYDLFVTPAARGTGAGRALMEAAEAHGRKRGRRASRAQHRPYEQDRSVALRVLRLDPRQRLLRLSEVAARLARGFVAELPHRFRWTLTGTKTGPGGSGRNALIAVRRHGTYSSPQFPLFVAPRSGSQRAAAKMDANGNRRMNMQEFKSAGRVVGVLIALQIVGGVVGNFTLTAPVFAAPGFLVNAAMHPLNLSLSALVGIATGILILGVAITAFPMIRRHSESLALWLFAFSVANFAVGVAEQIALLSLQNLSNAYTDAAATDEALFQALRGVVAAARNWAHYVHLVITGGTLFVFFGALCRYALVPRILAAFGMVATLLQMTGVAMPLFGREVAFPLLAPMGLAMLATAVWLLVRGFNDRHPATRTVPV